MDYFMQEAKIKRRIQEIEALRYRKKYTIQHGLSQKIRQSVKNIRHFSTEQVAHIGENVVKRRIAIYGFKRKSPFPEDENILFLIFGKTGGGTTPGFGSLLFIDESAPVQGIDANHKEFLLLEPAHLGKKK